MKILIFILLMLPNFVTSVAQVSLVKSDEQHGQLNYIIEPNVKYIIKKSSSQKIIDFNTIFKEGEPGTPVVPSNNIFIALPPNTYPEITATVLEKNEIDAFPELNPKIELVNDKLEYQQVSEVKRKNVDLIKVNGFLWIGNNYCADITIHPVYFDTANKLQIVQKMSITVSSPNFVLRKRTKSVGKVSPIILNKNFALAYQSKPLYKYKRADEWIDYNNYYIKLGVNKDGIYRINYSDFDSLGINQLNINPKTFKLFCRGNEIPIYVKGEDKSVFATGDFIEFVGQRNMGGHHRELSGYGQPYNEYLGRYTDTTIYWLTWYGNSGLRAISEKKEFVKDLDTLNYYSQIDHFEKNNWFDYSSPSITRRENSDWLENETWHEGNLRVGKSNKPFTVSNLVDNTYATAFIKLQDYASNIQIDAHKLILDINTSGNISDTTSINKYEKKVIKYKFASDLLKEGKNYLNITSLPTLASINACIFDWYEIEYPRYLSPIEGELVTDFGFLSSKKITNVKFSLKSSPEFVLWKKGIQTVKLNQTVDEHNQIIFADTLNSNTKYYYSEVAKIRKPKIYYKKQFNNLTSSSNSADYLIITHKKFITGAEAYSQFIMQNYDLKTKIIDVDDVYDYFDYGFFNPEVIREFLKAAYDNWVNPAPKYVLLLGGATYDYYGNKFNNFSAVTKRVINYVPSYGAPVSDNWYVTWDSTGASIPVMNIGRLPVTSNKEIDWYLSKHKKSLEDKFAEWNKRFLFFSGGDEYKESEITILRNTNEQVIENYAKPAPVAAITKHFYKTANPKTDFGPYSDEVVKEEISKGGLLISYLGHSGTQTWDNSILSPEQLSNSVDRYPLVTDFGCSTARFAESDVTSFSQMFVLGDNSQALAYVGNSSLGFLSTSLTMPNLFYKSLLSDGITNIYEALKTAKAKMIENYGYSDAFKIFALTNSLIGDPILKLNLPPKPNLVIDEIVYPNSIIPNDEMNFLPLELHIKNIGRSVSDSMWVEVLQNYNNNVDTILVKRELPLNLDTMFVSVPIKMMPGEHSFTVVLDSKNNIEEIYEDDNSYSSKIVVQSASLRPLIDYKYENGSITNLSILNPVNNIGEEIFTIEVASDSMFTVLDYSQTYNYDTLATTIELKNLKDNKRYFFRIQENNSGQYSSTYSFFNGGNGYYTLADSLSFNKIKSENVSFTEDALKIDSTAVNIELASAGWTDGNFAHIKHNGYNYPTLNLRGHHVVLFDKSDIHFVKKLNFDVYSGSAEINRYIDFIDTLSSKYYVAIAISDEGRVRDNSLIAKLKSIGSQYIDKVGFRGAWIFWGGKDVDSADVIEKYAAEGEGAVFADTTLKYLSSTGKFVTDEISSASRFENLFLDAQTPSNSSIDIIPMSKNEFDHWDTLAAWQNIKNSEIDLSKLNELKNKKVKFDIILNTSSDNKSPLINSFSVNYIGLPEVGINYQTCSIASDTLTYNDLLASSTTIYNVGKSKCDSIKTVASLVGENGFSEVIFDTLLSTLSAGSKVNLLNEYLIAKNVQAGKYSFVVEVDPDNTFNELYKHNNSYSLPIIVKGDSITNVVSPTVEVLFNDKEIFNDEYIDANSVISISFSNNRKVDNLDYSIFIDDKLVSPSELEKSNLEVNSGVFLLKRKFANGMHKFEIRSNLLIGNLSGETGYKKTFNVSNEVKLIDVYNYPNPLSSYTYFTFKLPKMPENGDIKIYSISGRLLKTIQLDESNLNLDFNKIKWDGLDEDGDLMANGVYLYKVNLYDKEKTVSTIQKLAILR